MIGKRDSSIEIDSGVSKLLIQEWMESISVQRWSRALGGKGGLPE